MDWEKIEIEYITTNISQRALAEKYGVSGVSIAKQSKEKNWVKKREEFKQESLAKAKQEAVKKSAESLTDHFIAQRSKIVKIFDRYFDALSDEDKIAGATLSQITTAMGTLLDKYAAFDNDKADAENLIREAWERYWESIGPAFRCVAGDVFAHGHTHYDESGGRGSMKSSFISLNVIMLIVMHPDMHALVLRKVGNTMRDSVYAQYMWAIEKLGLAAEWDAKVSPLELIYKPTGQKIMFRGADDPMKIKSIKVPFGYIGITHFEEKDQFAGRKEIRTILQSTQRGGSLFWNFESFNPPITRDNWANKDLLEERADRLCHSSTYLEAPPEWLGEQFFAEAEHLKETDERAYRHEYLGEAVGTGGNVFEKLELREITDKEIASFDRIYMGVDWGFYPDAFAFIRMYYDRARETIYFIDEYYSHKQSNEDTGRWILDKGYTDAYIICDSAEPKSVADYRALGLPAKSAVKGPGSLDYSMKWLQKRTIVIDRRRTPHAAEEFAAYEYERDKDGEIISGYPDANDHVISAVRYGMEAAYRRMGVLA